MTAVAASSRFKENAHEALADARLQGALTYRRPISNRTTRTIRMMPSKPTPPWPNP